MVEVRPQGLVHSCVRRMCNPRLEWPELDGGADETCSLSRVLGKREARVVEVGITESV